MTMSQHKRKPRVSFEELKRLLREKLGGDAELLRGGWELIGDVLVLQLPGELYRHRYVIGETALHLHPRARSVVVRRGISHELRYPVAEVVAGERNTLTLHRENRCVFRVDPCRVMFSCGNQGERMRMARLELRGERVLDMFAGIGQFTIPMARHASPEKVVAIEKRPDTFELLCENVRLNRVEEVVEPLLGDCREVAPSGFADRVVMGYFFSPERFLGTALEALRSGGVVHYHTLAGKRELDAEGERVLGLIKELGYRGRVAERRVVKSYAPGRWHVVYDLEVG